eukprot:m51a1_g12528 hypothetical protein (492) ;mRNA; r:40-1861
MVDAIGAVASACQSAYTVVSFLYEWRQKTKKFPGELSLLIRELEVFQEALGKKKALVQPSLVKLIEETMTGILARLKRMQARQGLIWTLLKGWKLAELGEIRADLGRINENMAFVGSIPTDPLEVQLGAILTSCQNIPGAVDFWRNNVAALEIGTDNFIVRAWSRAGTTMMDGASRDLREGIDDNNNGSVSAAEYARWCANTGKSPPEFLRSWKPPPPPEIPKILWVDDLPENNEAWINGSSEMRFELITSTPEAIACIKAAPESYAAIITDMARVEMRANDPKPRKYPAAGLDMIKILRRKLQCEVTIIVFVSEESVKNRMFYESCLNAGATEVVADINSFLNRSMKLDPDTYVPFNYKRPPKYKQPQQPAEDQEAREKREREAKEREKELEKKEKKDKKAKAQELQMQLEMQKLRLEQMKLLLQQQYKQPQQPLEMQKLQLEQMKHLLQQEQQHDVSSRIRAAQEADVIEGEAADRERLENALQGPGLR